MRFAATVLVEQVGVPHDVLAQRCGVTRRTVERWASGRVMFTAWQADRWATFLGWHPALVWDDWWLGVDVEAAA